MPFFGIPIRNGLPIGLGSVAGFGVAPEFSPADLFLGGINGAWYDPSDSTTLFSDTAGTTPCAAPGAGAQVVVGLMLDKSAPAATVGNYSGFFDGTGDFLSCAASSAFDITSGDFTVECWVYRTVSGTEQYLFSQRSSSGWEFRINATNLFQFFFTAGSAITSASTVPANAWTHLAVTRSGNTVRLFLNGTQDASATFSNGTSASSTALYLAWGTTGGGLLTGYLSNARIVKGTAVYTGNFTPSGPLTAISGTALLTCQNNYFKDNSTNNFAVTVNGNAAPNLLNPFDSTAARTINNAASYNSTTARPELSARVNLLTYSEQFDNAAWTKVNATIANDTVVAPDGTLSADNVVEATGTVVPNVNVNVSVTSGIAYTLSVYAKAAGRSSFQFYWTAGNPTGTPFVNFDLSLGTATVGGTGATATISAVGNGWYRCTATYTASSTASQATVILVTNSPSAARAASYTGNGIDGIYLWGAQLIANNAFPANTYQRIADQYTYDNSASFPRYLRFDGVDDGMYTPANLNLSSTDKVTVFAGVRQVAAGNQQLVELSVDVNTNNGAFSMPKDAVAPAIWTTGLRGTATTSASSSAIYAAPISTINTALFDIALSADEAKLRINGVQVATSGAISAGTGNFGAYPLYIGSRANSTVWFNGNIYSLIVRGAATDASTISATETWVANETGISIFDNGPSLGLDFTAQTYQVWEV